MVHRYGRATDYRSYLFSSLTNLASGGAFAAKGYYLCRSNVGCDVLKCHFYERHKPVSNHNEMTSLINLHIYIIYTIYISFSPGTDNGLVASCLFNGLPEPVGIRLLITIHTVKGLYSGCPLIQMDAVFQ